MHELSIAMNIVEICSDEAEKAGAASISNVEVEIGSLSGIEAEALDFSWEVATKNSLLEGSSLSILQVTALAKCIDCNKEFEMPDSFAPCPGCGSFRNEILKGRELKIKAITVD
jgi:hydrogenase nickel incorporation protein HypA/HybF